jgi:hypothetical protein
VVKDTSAKIGIPKISPHDCRRTCARLCHAAGANLSRSSSYWGTFRWKQAERYLGCKQRLRGAVNDRIGLEP